MEFDLIHQYFKLPFQALLEQHRDRVPRGIGDDCARLSAKADHLICLSTDSLESGIHFFEDVSAWDLGWKSLAVNLSDLAACGAQPLGFTLNLGLSGVDHSWLNAFSQGLLKAAEQYECPLIGGDTTRRLQGTGVTITVYGQTPQTFGAFDRAQAKLGDEIWVTGYPGLARLGLVLERQSRGVAETAEFDSSGLSLQDCLQAMPESLKLLARKALCRPLPRVEAGLGLRNFAHAAIDLSDGLGGDLAHILEASRLGATLSLDRIDSIWHSVWPEGKVWSKLLRAFTLSGGDDYELCFTAPELAHQEIEWLSNRLKVPMTAIGGVCSEEGVYLHHAGDKVKWEKSLSFQHF